MYNACNFKVFLYDKWLHIYNLVVYCHRDVKGGYFYSVCAVAYNTIVNLSFELGFPETFDTQDEAYEFIDKVAPKYPIYGDERDYDIELAPIYEEVEI